MPRSAPPHDPFDCTAWSWAVSGLPVGVRGLFTLRSGGLSQPPFDQWNLGDHVGDDAQRVAANRQLLAERLHARPVFLKQVHGKDVLQLTHDTPDGLQADACWTDLPGLACTVMVADCLPLLMATPGGQSVAAVHAGWRGLAGQDGLGVIESLLMQWPAAQDPAVRGELRVWLGPCIGPQAFEVGAEVREAFRQSLGPVDDCFRALPGHVGKFLANLPLLARRRLQRAGVQHINGNDGSAAWCTVTQTSRFFSHRRDAVRLGSTGRMAACIWRQV